MRMLHFTEHLVHSDSESEAEYFDEEGTIDPFFDLEEQDIKEEKEEAIKELIEQYWKHLEEPYLPIKPTVRHWTKPKAIKGIKKVKEILKVRLGYVTVYVWLQMYAKCGDIRGVYKNSHKAFLLLYQMVIGCPVSHLEKFMPSSSIAETFDDVFKKNNRKLGEFIEEEYMI